MDGPNAFLVFFLFLTSCQYVRFESLTFREFEWQSNVEELISEAQ